MHTCHPDEKAQVQGTRGGDSPLNTPGQSRYHDSKAGLKEQTQFGSKCWKEGWQGETALYVTFEGLCVLLVTLSGSRLKRAIGNTSTAGRHQPVCEDLRGCGQEHWKDMEEENTEEGETGRVSRSSSRSAFLDQQDGVGQWITAFTAKLSYICSHTAKGKSQWKQIIL